MWEYISFIHSGYVTRINANDKWVICNKLYGVVRNASKNPFLVLSHTCGLYYFLIAIRWIYTWIQSRPSNFISPVAWLLPRTFIFTFWLFWGVFNNELKRYFMNTRIENSFHNPLSDMICLPLIFLLIFWVTGFINF